MTVAGIDYSLPKVFLLADTGIGNAEFAARTCYNSFDMSNSDAIKNLNEYINGHEEGECNLYETLFDMSELEDSELLKQLSFVHFHHSVLEHNVVTFFIKGTSRGVLQELARHRIASYSVKSTRYTLDNIMYNFIVAKYIINDVNSKDFFINQCTGLDLLVTTTKEYNSLEFAGIWDKLSHQALLLGKDEFISLIIPKANIQDFLESSNYEDAFVVLTRKKKRNVGDSFKHIITDNFKTDLTMTVNLRSLKNFFDLRLSGAAWFQIQWLAKAMKEVLPEHSKKLIFKSDLN